MTGSSILKNLVDVNPCEVEGASGVLAALIFCPFGSFGDILLRD